MKKIFLERGLVFFVVFIAFLISGYLYKEGKISFVPRKDDKSVIQNTASELPFVEKEYHLSYNGKAQYSMLEVAGFEDTERWQGDGEFDYANYYEGKSSLSLNSQNHSLSKASLNLIDKSDQGGSFDLNEILEMRLLVNIRSEVANIEGFSLTLFDRNGNIYHYPLGSFSESWNLLVLPKDRFDVSKSNSYGKMSSPAVPSLERINKIEFTLVSRPKTVASLNLEYLWTERSNLVMEDWYLTNPKYLTLKSDAFGTGVLYLGLLSGNANLKAISSAKDYSVSMRFTPLSNGSFGLFLRGDYKSGFGYLFILDGVGRNTWQINKSGIFDQKQQTIILAKGSISNFELGENKPFWLKAKLKGDHFAFYLSLNGKDFARIGEATDSSFASGGVGFASGGAVLLVDEVQFFQ